MTKHEPADHRGALGDLYDDLQLYREAEFSLDHTVRATLIAGRRTCASQQLYDPTPAQEQATANLVRALSAWQEAQVAEGEKRADPPPPSEKWDWQEAQVAEGEKRADPPPPSEKWDENGICLACEGRGRDSEDLFCHSCGGQGDRCSYEQALKERKTREDGKQSYRPEH